MTTSELDTQEPRIKVLKNGARYDLDKKRIVSGAVLDSETASNMQRKGVARKHELVALGAGRAVQDKRLLAEFGADAHIVERAMTLQTIATTPDAGKAAIMAHDALTRDTGTAEPKATEAGTAVADAFASTVAALLQALSPRDVVDPIVTDAETGEVVGGGGE